MTYATDAITVLLFDWDGTVVDSAQLGQTAFERSFADLGLVFDHQIYRATYSPNWYTVYEALGLPREQWERADELWVQHYGEQTAQLVEGAGQTLQGLKQKGYRLGVVSSGNDHRVRREMQELAVELLFEVVVCNEQMENKKPHPEGLHTAMQVLGCSQVECCYVGDSPEDIEMGKRAGLMTVGVRSAFPTSWKIESYGPDIYLESFSGLESHF